MKKKKKFSRALKFKAIDALVDKWATEAVSTYIPRRKRLFVNKTSAHGPIAQIILDVNTDGQVVCGRTVITTEFTVLDKKKLRFVRPENFGMTFPDLVGPLKADKKGFITLPAKVGSLPIKKRKRK